MKNKEENIWDNIQFPIVKNISPKTIGESIAGITAEETAKAMKEMFDKFEKETGFKPVIKGNTLPTRVLFPKENK